jgi:hypothetical protein
MKNQLVNSNTPYRRKIETAIAESRQRSLALHPGIWELSCVCAVHDKPYTLRFNRRRDGLLHLAASIKGKAAPAISGDNGRAASAASLPLIQFATETTACAWCGDGSFHYCKNDCGALVCCGLIVGKTFRCRASCGAEWVGIPLLKVAGTPRADKIASLAAPPKRTVRPAKRLLLTDGFANE